MEVGNDELIMVAPSLARISYCGFDARSLEIVRSVSEQACWISLTSRWKSALFVVSTPILLRAFRVFEPELIWHRVN